MGNDATEAALGLLGLTSATFDTVPTVPLKRKQSPPSSSRHQHQPASTSTGSDTISCICGFTYDDGFSIGCDSCARWCHAACFGIVESEVPEEWQCWVCSPRPVDKERAIRIQKARQRTALSHEAEKQRRRMSPGVDRKGRKTSGSTAEGGGSGHTKRKRRASMAATPSHEDEHVDIDEPWALSYVHTNNDIVPHNETRDRLRRVAARWRGVTSLQPTSSEPTTPATLELGDYQSSPLINLRPLPPSSFLPSISANLDPAVRPPAYAAHTVRPIPSSGMITPYTSTITPSTVYLADPLNAYAHLSMPKPFVHLIGPPLDVALDSRATGNFGRFVRSGCRPNAVLRPVICPRSKSRATPAQNDTHNDDDRETLTFGVFALRDLKAHEEVVLGWEWDDGSVVHQLPALIDSPHIFPPHELQHLRHQLTSMLHALSSTFTTCACGSKTRDCALARIAEFVDSQSPPTPSPSPPTPFATEGDLWGTAGERSRVRSGGSDSSVKKRASLGPLIGTERGFRTRERVPWSGGLGGVEMVPTSSTHAEPLSPVEPPRNISGPHAKSSKDRKGKSRATESDYAQWEYSTTVDHEVDEGRPSTPPAPPEANLPPKLRKQWMRKASDSLRSTHSPTINERPIGVVEEAISTKAPITDEPMQVDDSTVDPEVTVMPPPPLPPRLAALSPRSPSAIALPNSPTLPGPHDSLSPSSRFANLSLLSPVPYGPPFHFFGNARRISTSPTPPPSTPSPPAHQDDEAPEQPSPAKEVETSSMTPSVQDQPHAEPASSAETDARHHSEDALLENSQSETTNCVPTQSTPGKHDAALPSHSAFDVAVKETVPVDVSVGPVEKASTPDVHDVAMSSPATPSINVTEESAEPLVGAAAPPVEEVMPEPAPEKPRTPSPPPRPVTPKVKLSLKDFAARKKKLREAGKAHGRQGSVAPSDAASSLPNTPAGQLATLADSPAVVTASLAPTSEPPVKVVASAPLDEPHLSSAARMSSQGEVVPNSISAIAPSDEHKEPLVEPIEKTSHSVEERLVRARDVPPHQSLRLKLEVMEPAVLPETRMVNGQRPTSETDSAEDSTYSSKPADDSFRPTEPKDVVEAPTGPRTPPRYTRLRTPSFTVPTDYSQREEFGPKTPPRPRAHSPRLDRPLSLDGAHEDGEIVSPPPSKAVPLPPRSSSPPTHPRAYYPPSRGPSEFPPAPRRPFRHQTLQNTLPPDRHLPRAPRALRESLYPVLPGRPPPPRGPSADREWERERERDRGWVTSSRGRGRGGWNR